MSAVARSFTSIFGPDIAAYVALKKALGRGFATETAMLADLDAFLAGRSCDVSAESFAAWCLTLGRLTPTVRRNWMRNARNACLYRRRRDPECFVPDPTGFPTPHAPVRPHIFTEDEITRLLRAAATLSPKSTSPLYAEGMRLAVVLLYTTGLRRGELVRLVLSDYATPAPASAVRIHRGAPRLPRRDRRRSGQFQLQQRIAWIEPFEPGVVSLLTPRTYCPN
jgi:integrase